MRRLVLATMLLTMGLAGAALASVDMELAFSPTTAAPGDEVTLFTSIANLGDTDEVMAIDVTITFADFVIGPITAEMPLAAGEELTREFSFLVPMLPYGGDLVIDVAATTADGTTTTASATLTIVVDTSENSDPSADLNLLGLNYAKSLPGAQDTTLSFGELKAEFR